MNPQLTDGAGSTAESAPAAVVRRAIATLNSLDPETAAHLGAVAFVLMRVARADGQFCIDERVRMEEILVQDAGVTAEHAALVTEIARHRAALADCGIAYSISRSLRETGSGAQRRSIVRLLVAVADADGVFAPVEHDEIVQLAGELGIDGEELKRASSTSRC
jgi:uncharacterized tellurite resistance protein B-like protein